MLDWLVRHLFQLGARLLVTVAGVVTLHRVILEEGYRCELSTLFIGAAIAIVVLRLWMPWDREARSSGE